MATLATLDFSGTAGVDITTANTPLITNQGAGGTRGKFNNSVPPGYTDGTSSAKFDMSATSSFNRVEFTSRTGETWIEFYFMLLATSAANYSLILWADNANTQIGDLRFLAGTATMQLRDNLTGKYTTAAIAMNVWHRATVKCFPNTATGHRLKLYLGANRDGNVADIDSLNQIATGAGVTAIERYSFGLVSGTEAHIHFAGFQVYDSEPTPTPPASLPYNVDFTAGGNGADITTTNTPAITTHSNLFGTFDNDIPPNYVEAPYSASFEIASAGTLATGTSYNTVDFGLQPGVWLGFYFKLTAFLPVNSFYLQWFDSSMLQVGDLRFNASSATVSQTITLRDNFIARATSLAVPINQWHRCAIRSNPGSATGHRLKLYLGSNRHGSLADYDSGQVAANGTAAVNIEFIRFGLMTISTEARYKIARLRFDANEPASIVAGVTTSDVYYINAGAWTPASVKTREGGAWV